MKKLVRGAGAFLLSLWIPGLGQVFNSQALLGIALFLAYALILAFGVLFHLLLSFRPAVGWVLVVLTFRLAVAIIAGRAAVRQVITKSVQQLKLPSYALGAALIAIATVPFINPRFPEETLGVRAFRIPADSMSPTIINGDHLIVDMRYYKTHSPERGDLVVYVVPQSNVLYVKRVVAVGGDMIATDTKGTMLNGNRVAEPYLYLEGKPDADMEKFGPVTVPTNQIFVMGDNRNHSYDSRYTGTVGVDRVIGKPLFIYYSSGRPDRIGRTIQ
jgi:signal peptidase I